MNKEEMSAKEFFKRMKPLWAFAGVPEEELDRVEEEVNKLE